MAVSQGDFLATVWAITSPEWIGFHPPSRRSCWDVCVVYLLEWRIVLLQCSGGTIQDHKLRSKTNGCANKLPGESIGRIYLWCFYKMGLGRYSTRAGTGDWSPLEQISNACGVIRATRSVSPSKLLRLSGELFWELSCLRVRGPRLRVIPPLKLNSLSL
jgi:hypothetical protein